MAMVACAAIKVCTAAGVRATIEGCTAAEVYAAAGVRTEAEVCAKRKSRRRNECEVAQGSGQMAGLP